VSCKFRIVDTTRVFGRCGKNGDTASVIQSCRGDTCEYWQVTAPSRPCKWRKPGMNVDCHNPNTNWNYCTFDANCTGYTPAPPEPECKGTITLPAWTQRFVAPEPERKEPCKWLLHTGCHRRFAIKLDGPCPGPDACEHYEPKVPMAASSGAEGYYVPGAIKFNFTEEHEQFVEAVEAETGKFNREYAWRYQFENNKEDNDMSGNAFKCNSCRETFFIEEVYKVGGHSLKFDREEKKVEHDLFNGVCLCDKCYAKFRDATAPFNFPWDEWRKGDDDEG